MAATSSHSIFVSLTHQDTGIAEAIRDMFRGLFGEFVQVRFSTSKELEGGIRSGEDWFQWIVERVQDCDFALILITPSSIYKPWILWEAGAVAGAALASRKEGLRKVRPLVFQVDTEMIPSPIRDSKAQFRRGDHADDVKSLAMEILADYRKDPNFDDRVLFEAAQKLDQAVAAFLQRVQACLLNAPALPSPVVLEEWRLRLDEVLAKNRPSEVDQLHDWMNIAFGRDAHDRPQPLDLRIHTRLADIYLRAAKYPRAIEQLELAQQLAPRDIFVLRQLGRAYLENGDRDKAKAVLDRITALDARAIERNAECAALAGRWYRSAGDLAKAEEIFARALNENPESYYLANVLAEVRLEMGAKDRAADAFRRVMEILGRLGETNAWTNASAANAAFFLGDDDGARTYLSRVARAATDAESLRIIERGLHKIAAHVPDGDSRLAALLPALHA